MSLVPEHIKNLSPYVAGKRIEEVKKQFNLKSVIKLASNENPFGPSPLAIERVKNTLNFTNRYPDSSGYDLRSLLAEKHMVNIDNVIIGNGSEGIMSAAIRTFLNKGDELISAEDSFIGFRVLANASGKKIHWVKMKDYRYDLHSISKKINKNTKIIYLANPDNPTGTYFRKNEFEKFISNVPERVLVILDEAYYEYAHNYEDFPDSMSYRLDNVITLRTFSKCYGLAGFRVGYGFAHHTLIENLLKVKLPFEPSIPAQEAAIGSLEDSKYLKKILDSNQLGMDYLSSEFVKIKVPFIKSCANFITIIFDSQDVASKFLKLMLKSGIILRGLSNFGLPNCVRVTIGTIEENKIFIKKLKEVYHEL